MQEKTKREHFESLKNNPLAYGGRLFNTRKGRSRGRPLSARHTMHLVLRSSLAREAWSFSASESRVKIDNIVRRFSIRNQVRVISYANVGNHLHFHIQLTRISSYQPFIRAVTSAIAMAVTGVSRWQAWDQLFKYRPAGRRKRYRFWTGRPFTRIIVGSSSLMRMRDYIKINQLEGAGIGRESARWLVRIISRAGP